MKKWILSKNCLKLFVSGREKKTAFSLGPKTVKLRKENYKNSVFSGKCLKSKVFVGMGEKDVFLLTVLSKKLVLLKAQFFMVFSAKHSSCSKKKSC